MKLGILALALLIGSASFGQEKTTKKSEPQREQRQTRTPKTAEERATNMTERMTKQLGLSDDQKSKIYEINLGIAQKNDGIRSNTALTKEDRRKQMQENHASRKAMYKEVLTPDQYAKYEAWEQEKKAKMEAKRKEHQSEKTGGKKGGKAGKGAKTTTPPVEDEEEDVENEL